MDPRTADPQIRWLSLRRSDPRTSSMKNNYEAKGDDQFQNQKSWRLFLFLTLPYDLQDLSFWPETEHLAGGSESQESQPLGHQGTPVKADHVSDTQWGQTNLKCRSLEQTKFYCRALYGRQVAHALKHTDFPKGYRKTLVKHRRELSQGLWSARAQFSDWLMMGRVMLQELTLSVFWLQEAWSHVLMALKWLTSST